MKKFGVVFYCLLGFSSLFAQCIDHGPEQNITDDMNYEEVHAAIERFYRYSRCKKIPQEITGLFFDQNGKSTWPPSYVLNKQLPYKQKKKMLLKQYEKAIEYIKEFYASPTELLEQKFLSPVTTYGRSGFCCAWHGTALAQKDSAKAQFAIGARLFRNSIYDTQSIKENAIWLQYAGENGITKAYWILGKKSFQFKEYETAIKWYKEGAEDDDADCMCALGDICRYQLKDYATALTWYVPAAESGHLGAILGCAYIFSRNTNDNPADYRQAIKYYRMAIVQEEKHKTRRYQENIRKYREKIKELELKVED